MKAAKVVLIAGLLLLLFSGGGIAYLVIYLDNHKDLLASGASEALGRRIEVRDGVTVAWSMQPRFVLDGVWVANPGWASEAYFARVERVSLQIDLWALLTGRIEIRQLMFNNADFSLETGPDGSANWGFGSEARTGAGFDIDSLQVQGSRLRYQSAGGIEYRLDITALELAGLGGDAPALTAQARYLDIPVTVTAELGPDASSDTGGWPFKGRVESGDATLEISGHALAPFVLSGGEIQFDLQSQDLRSLQSLLRQQNLPQGPFRIAARLAVQQGNYRFHTIRGSMDFPDLIQQVAVTGGEATISADGALSGSLQGSWHAVPATLEFTLAGTDGQEGEGGQGEGGRQLDLAATLAGLELRSRGQLTPAAGLEWDLDLDLQAADLAGLDPFLTGGWRPDTPVALSARVAKSARAYAFTGLTARFGDSGFSGDLQLAMDGQRLRLAGNLLAKRLDLGAFVGGEQSTAADEHSPHWGDIPLPKIGSDAFDIDVTMNVRQLVAGKLRADDAKARVLLENGRLQLKSMNLSLPGLPVIGQATFNTSAQPPTLDLALRSERIDFPRALHAISPSARTAASIRKASVKLSSNGATPRELIANAKGELATRSVHLTLPAGEGAKAKQITLTNAKLQARPKKPVRLHTKLVVAGHDYTLDLTSGPLSDLLRSKRPWKTIQVAARGEINNRPVEIQGHLGPWSALVAGRDLSLDLTARHDGTNAYLHGILDRLDQFPGRGLSLRLSGPSLARLGSLLGIQLPESKLFEFDSRIESSDGGLSLMDFRSTIGDSDISGEARIVSGAKMRVEATLDSSQFDLTPHLPAGATSVHGTLPDLTAELPLDVLHAIVGELHWHVRQLRIKDLVVHDLKLDALLDAGHLRLDMNAGTERLIGNVEIKPEGTVWRLTLKHKGKFDLGWLFDEGEGAGAHSLAPAALDVDVRALGKSGQALLASAEGRVEVQIGAGRINKEIAVLPLSGIFVTLLETLSSSSEGEQGTKLECAVLKMDISEGIATSPQGIAMQTDKLNVLGAGTLNLSTGEIDFHFKTVKRSGLGVSILGIADRFVRIAGTLQKPEVTVDPKGLLIHGAAALATSGVTLLFDNIASRLTSFGNPCDTVLKEDKNSRPK